MARTLVVVSLKVLVALSDNANIRQLHDRTKSFTYV